jgi:hypothetical protein
MFLMIHFYFFLKFPKVITFIFLKKDTSEHDIQNEQTKKYINEKNS